MRWMTMNEQSTNNALTITYWMQSGLHINIYFLHTIRYFLKYHNVEVFTFLQKYFLCYLAYKILVIW